MAGGIDGKMPPANLDAERCVLGSLLLMNDSIDEVADFLSAQHFYSDRHQAIYAAIHELYEAGVRGIDVVTLSEQLERRQKLEECGGPAYLLEILQAVPHAAHARYYGEIVRRRANERLAQAALHGELHRLVTDPDADPAAALIRAAEKVAGLRTGGPDVCRTAAEVLRRYDPLGEPEPRRFWVGEGGFMEVDLRPGRLLGIIAAPGAGKTSWVMQMVTDALRLGLDLHAVVMNVEVTPELLIDRELARMSGVDLDLIINRRLGEDHRDRVEYGLTRIGEIADRLCFAGSPFTVETLEAAVRRHHPDIVVLDYVQRIKPKGEHGSRIEAIDAVVSSCRDLALGGIAVVAVSAASRQRSSAGSAGYANLGLASFRGSSELEYGVDDAYALEPDADDPSRILARHVKSRHGRRVDLALTFDGACQSWAAETSWSAAASVFPAAGGAA